jgi:flagellar biosynthesis protein FlhF
MHVKRVYQATVREALAEVRAQLGPDALVLSTELVPAPGWRGWLGRRVVRLTAAAERPGLAAVTPVPEAAELSAPRTPVTTRRHRSPDDSARAGVVARLIAAGMDPALAEPVAARMTDAECRGGSDRALRRALSAELEPLSGAPADYERCEVFVGPPGVGKTTTIAKIAAQERVRHRRALNLVSADGFRAGAIEQLRSYAEVLAVPFRAARTAAELQQALSHARNPILVDTPGRSAADDDVTGMFEVLCRRRHVRTHLVLAADTSPAAARRVFDRYARLEPSRVVITKLDECDSVTPLLAVVREQGLPVSYLTTGQRIPEDLWRATPASLAAALLREPAMEEYSCH